MMTLLEHKQNLSNDLTNINREIERLQQRLQQAVIERERFIGALNLLDVLTQTDPHSDPSKDPLPQ